MPTPVMSQPSRIAPGDAPFDISAGRLKTPPPTIDPTTSAISGRRVSFGVAVSDFGLPSTDMPSADSLVAIGVACAVVALGCESLRRSEVVPSPVLVSPVLGIYLARLVRQPSHHTRLPLRTLRGSHESVVRKYSPCAVPLHHSRRRDEHHVARRGNGSA